jgi:phytoene dehydrogenase-like protein
LSRMVEKVQTKRGAVCGVHIKGDGLIPCKVAVAGCDAMQTFRKLLGRTKTAGPTYQRIKTLIPSPSLFILYLGVDSGLKNEPYPGSNIWMLSYDDLEAVYDSIQPGNFEVLLQNYLLHIAPDRSHLSALMYAPYRTRSFWQKRKGPLMQEFVKKIENDRIPLLTQHITYCGAATPQTLNRYTKNYHGAAYGWAGMLPQVALPEIRRPEGIAGLYLTGHWSTYGLGIPGVAYVARDTAGLIIKKTVITAK